MENRLAFFLRLRFRSLKIPFPFYLGHVIPPVLICQNVFKLYHEKRQNHLFVFNKILMQRNYIRFKGAVLQEGRFGYGI